MRQGSFIQTPLLMFYAESLYLFYKNSAESLVLVGRG